MRCMGTRIIASLTHQHIGQGSAMSGLHYRAVRPWQDSTASSFGAGVIRGASLCHEAWPRSARHGMAQVSRAMQRSLCLQRLLLIVVLGATCMLIGDGTLTPAISVVSSITGLEQNTSIGQREPLLAALLHAPHGRALPQGCTAPSRMIVPPTTSLGIEPCEQRGHLRAVTTLHAILPVFKRSLPAEGHRWVRARCVCCRCSWRHRDLLRHSGPPVRLPATRHQQAWALLCASHPPLVPFQLLHRHLQHCQMAAR